MTLDLKEYAAIAEEKNRQIDLLKHILSLILEDRKKITGAVVDFDHLMYVNLFVADVEDFVIRTCEYLEIDQKESKIVVNSL